MSKYFNYYYNAVGYFYMLVLKLTNVIYQK